MPLRGAHQLKCKAAQAINLTLKRDEVLATLRELAAARPSNPVELNALQARCASLSQRLLSHADLADQMPEIVWHFLSDADIRYKDPRYAQLQFAQMDALLCPGGKNSA